MNLSVKFIIFFLDFVRRLNYEIGTFRMLSFAFVIERKRERGQKTYMLVPVVQLASNLDDGQSPKVSF
jgi:hypothetical protein